MTIVAVPITSGSAYSSTDGIAAFLRRNSWLKSPIVSEALTGPVTATNKRFRLQSYPALSGTVSIIDVTGASVVTSSVDEDSGVVITSAVPTDMLFANFTHCAYTSTQLDEFFVEGFNLMESIWQRGYFSVISSGVYYVSSESDSIVDPVISDSTFMSRPIQYSLLTECIQLIWAQSVWNESAANAIQVRESLAAGVNIDRTKQPSALKDLVAEAERRVKVALENAMLDAGVSWFYDEDGLAIAGTSDPYPNEWKTPIYASGS